uniref:Putative diaminopimelate decarboxylase n=1 Tax=Magnetococcus massalia (strain MO-1) TaxID=451514 RepID=A0A1S7LMK7_MAGMO|nr:putative diaminopimelate decarboxylase [Candidatus Magnetococcus massalia]
MSSPMHHAATEQVQTPCYLYDLAAIEARAQAIQRALGAELDLYYAIKANPAMGLLRAMQPMVDGVDLSSERELQRALKAGYGAGKMSFAGPGKSDEALAQAVEAEIGSISVESLGELKRLAQQARQLGKTARITIRFNPAVNFPGYAIRMGGRASAFGVDELQLPELLHWIASEGQGAVELVGLHAFTGTQCMKPETLRENFNHTMQVAVRIAEEHGVRFTRLNFGGGLGIPYQAGQEPIDGDGVLHQLAEDFATWKRAHPAMAAVRGIVELGRYLVGEAGWYVTTVVDCKRSREEAFAILDGGMHHHLAASGNFGQVIRRNFPLQHLTAKADRPVEKVTLNGPLCTSLDLMADRAELPQVQVGDRIAILSSGAYGLTASSLLFLSHATPYEYLLRPDGTLQLLRQSVDPTTLGEVDG